MRYKLKRMPTRIDTSELPGVQKLKLNVPTLFGLGEQRGVLTRWLGNKWYLFESTAGTEFTVSDKEVLQ